MEPEPQKENTRAEFPTLVKTDDSIIRIIEDWRLDPAATQGKRARALYIPTPDQEKLLGLKAAPSRENGKWLDYDTAVKKKID